MSKKLGIIGTGNMGTAILGGVIQAEVYEKEDIMVSARTDLTLEKIKRTYGVIATKDNKEIARKTDIIILAVKPNMYDVIIQEIKDDVKEDTIIIGIAAGKSIMQMEQAFHKKVKIAKAMPNTPVLVKEGMSAISLNAFINEEDQKAILAIFEGIGRVGVIQESLMNIYTAISGSSPAYVYMFIEAMADAGVQGGLTRQQAYEFSAQAVLGAAKMVLETKEHPGVLKDQVCSPGGTTIAAVCELEKQGLRSAVIAGVEACCEKSKVMSK